MHSHTSSECAVAFRSQKFLYLLNASKTLDTFSLLFLIGFVDQCCQAGFGATSLK